jgi:hypothetical protein
MGKTQSPFSIEAGGAYSDLSISDNTRSPNPVLLVRPSDVLLVSLFLEVMQYALFRIERAEIFEKNPCKLRSMQ